MIRDAEIREIGDYEVLIKVKSCGVCGTDLGTSEKYETFGHEIAGIVEKIGNCVTGINPGDSVVVESSSFCGVCDHCRNGRVDLCENIISGSFSGFAEYTIAAAKNVMKYDGLSFKQASVMEPLGVALDLVYAADIKLNDHVLVIGAGSIGLMALRLAKAMGAGKIFVAQHSGSQRKNEVAKAFGADDILFTDRQRLEDYPFPKGGVDKVLITAPPKTIPSAFNVSNYGAVIAFIGISPEANITFDANAFHFKKLQLRSSYASPALYFPTAVEMVKSGIIDTDLLISHTFGLQEIAGMMKTIATDRSSVVKCVMLA